MLWCRSKSAAMRPRKSLSAAMPVSRTCRMSGPKRTAAEVESASGVAVVVRGDGSAAPQSVVIGCRISRPSFASTLLLMRVLSSAAVRAYSRKSRGWCKRPRRFMPAPAEPALPGGLVPQGRIAILGGGLGSAPQHAGGHQQIARPDHAGLSRFTARIWNGRWHGRARMAMR